MSTDFVVPTEIPWEDLKGRELEECLYWLMHALGAKDLEWRLGGTGVGGSDGGRDLEARFFVPGPDGEISRQNWWLEAKGRSETVEPHAVKEAVMNAAGRPDLDVLIVATNTTFSNPTRDWLQTWQASTPRPVIRLWDRNHLERLICGHPEVAIRLFSRALSPQGKLELDVVRSRFWNFTAYAGEPILEELWSSREMLLWSDKSLVAIIMSECANGRITTRPWAMTATPDFRLTLFTCALLNIFTFTSRAADAGVAIEPYIDGASYLLLACLQTHEAPRIVDIIRSAWPPDDDCDHKAHDEMRHNAITPIIHNLFAQLRDVCTSDCRRVATEPYFLSEREIKTYWSRLALPADSMEAEDIHLTVESLRRRCKVGFRLSKRVTCPLILINRDQAFDLPEQLAILQTVTKSRGPKPKPRA